MKKIIIIVLLSTAATFSQNVSPQFSELKGMEDQSGNTHLFYRINTATYDSISHLTNRSNNIYHFDLLNQQDTLFLESYMRFDSINYYPEDFAVFDLAFWQSNPIYYIYGGATQLMILNEQTFIQRFDSENTYDKGGLVHLIEISSQNDNLLYAGVNVFDYSGFIGTIRSTDGGWNWERLPDIFEILSLNPLNDQIFLARNEITKNLYRTTNGGSSYNLVDTSMTYQEQQYHNDQNENHIYRVTRNFFTREYELKVSSNSGEAFTWATKYISSDQIFISNNASFSGEIYLADKKNIYLSTDYGDNFNLYRSLDDNIVGIYKKPDSGLLYAATKYRIYEIDLPNGSIKIIKSITPVSKNYSWYPLSIGNYWLYEKFVIENGTTQFVGYETKHIVDNIIKQNGKKYFKMLITYSGSSTDSLFIRLDSTTAQIFAFDHSIGDELFFEDLSAELGDTVCYDFNPAWTCQYVQLEEEFSVFGLTTLKKVYEPEAPGWYFGHSLVKGIGLYKIWNGDTVPFWAILKGCIINGVVYGDTTVVSVEDETPNLPTEFSLSQNYPNPFNPSTKISWQSPVSGWQTLKVYDVLGNEITTLVNEEKPAGENEVEFSVGQNSILSLSSGIYFYRLRAGSFIQTKKMILIR